MRGVAISSAGSDVGSTGSAGPRGDSETELSCQAGPIGTFIPLP